MSDFIFEVKKKKEFSMLPDSLVEKALELNEKDTKKTRAFLRKYFGVFLTNKVLKLEDEKILGSHISSKGRDYEFFYKKILGNEKFNSIFDVGCGVNGFSYSFLKKELENVNYVGVEAVGQITEKTNLFFKKNNFNAKTLCMDIFDLTKIEKVFSYLESPKVIFLLQVIDALEGFEKNFSKKLLVFLKERISEKDLIVISMPMKSISGRNKFEARRNWLRYFLEENFSTEESFVANERIFKCRKK